MPRSNNQFARQDHYDHKILNEDGKVIGHIRVKPSGVLWCPKSSHQWYGLTLEQFANYAEKNGRKQKQ